MQKFISAACCLLISFSYGIASQADLEDDNEPHLSPFLADIEERDENIYKMHPELHPPIRYTPRLVLRTLTRACDPDIDPGVIIEADNILREDLYLRTNPPNDRSIHDLPQNYFLACYYNQFYWQFFYNQTTRMHLTKDGDTLRSYLAFDNPTIVQKLEDFAFSIDAPRILSALRNVVVHERRAGVMFGGYYQCKSQWNFEARTPLIYLERNFFLSQEERRIIEDELTALGFSQGDFIAFARRHLISDKLGIGDTRLNIGYLCIDNPSIRLNAGFEATVPTAVAFAKGLLGHHFNKDAPPPPFDLVELLSSVSSSEQFQQMVNDFLLGALDKLSANLLQPSLGNGGHLGLGVFVDHELWVSPKLRFKTRATLEYLLPAYEERFYIFKKNPAEFDQFANIGPDPSEAECLKAFAFLQQQIIQTLYPSVFDTVVWPGFIFKLSNALKGFFKERWHLMIGHDLWWQQQETLGTVIATPAQRAAIRRGIAKKSAAYQAKLFGSLGFYKQGKNHDWCISFQYDQTYISSGIGRDFNLALKCEMLF